MKYKIEKSILEKKPTVFTYIIDNEKVIVKKRTITKEKKIHFFQKLFFCITKNPLLFPTLLDKKTNSVTFETDKLISLYDKNSKLSHAVELEKIWNK